MWCEIGDRVIATLGASNHTRRHLRENFRHPGSGFTGRRPLAGGAEELSVGRDKPGLGGGATMRCGKGHNVSTVLCGSCVREAAAACEGRGYAMQADGSCRCCASAAGRSRDIRLHTPHALGAAAEVELSEPQRRYRPLIQCAK